MWTAAYLSRIGNTLQGRWSDSVKAVRRLRKSEWFNEKKNSVLWLHEVLFWNGRRWHSQIWVIKSASTKSNRANGSAYGHGVPLSLYMRTDLTDALHDAFGFRTDHQIVSATQMKSICAKTKRWLSRKYYYFLVLSKTALFWLFYTWIVLFLSLQLSKSSP